MESPFALCSFFFGSQNTSKSADHIELLREQHKILAGEVALQTSALRQLSEEAAGNPQKELIQVSPWINFYSWTNIIKMHTGCGATMLLIRYTMVFHCHQNLFGIITSPFLFQYFDFIGLGFMFMMSCYKFSISLCECTFSFPMLSELPSIWSFPFSWKFWYHDISSVFTFNSVSNLIVNILLHFVAKLSLFSFLSLGLKGHALSYLQYITKSQDLI